MGSILDFLGLRRGGGDGLPAKNIFKRNLWLAGLAVLGILLLLFPSFNQAKNDEQRPSAADQPAAVSDEQENVGMSDEEENISKRLCAMLRQVEGAGHVEASVRLASSTREEFALNTTSGKKTTEEKDQAGGTRIITEDTASSQLVMNKNGTNGEQPVVVSETAPQIAGVLVVAEGANDARVKAKLFEATRVALGIEPQNILVLPMERR